MSSLARALPKPFLTDNQGVDAYEKHVKNMTLLEPLCGGFG